MASDDIREDQMTVVDTVNYLRGMNGNNSVLLPIGRLIDKNNVIGYKSLAQNDNLNDYRGNGVYGSKNTSYIESLINRPDGVAGEAVVLVLSCDDRYVFQMYINITANTIWVRFQNNEVWKTWKKISIS